MKTTLIFVAILIGQIIAFKEWWEDTKVLLN